MRSPPAMTTSPKSPNDPLSPLRQSRRPTSDSEQPRRRATTRASANGPRRPDSMWQVTDAESILFVPKPSTGGHYQRHALVFTTRTGRPIEPRNINRAFDVRCVRYGVRRITLHDTRRTCGSLLAALDVHPRIAMAILRHSRIALTMEIYTQVPDKVTRDALRRLSDWLDHDEDQGDEARR